MNYKLLVSIAAILVSVNARVEDSQAQTTVINSGSSGVVTIVPVRPELNELGRRNSLGWNTGYSALTTSSERTKLFGNSSDPSDIVSETVTRVVPNDALGNPVRYGATVNNRPNSAGWNTGYSTITSTYERNDPLGAYLGNTKSVTETKTQIVPNDALGQPIRPLWE